MVMETDLSGSTGEGRDTNPMFPKFTMFILLEIS